MFAPAHHEAMLRTALQRLAAHHGAGCRNGLRWVCYSQEWPLNQVRCSCCWPTDDVLLASWSGTLGLQDGKQTVLTLAADPLQADESGWVALESEIREGTPVARAWPRTRQTHAVQNFHQYHGHLSSMLCRIASSLSDAPIMETFHFSEPPI